MDKALDLRQYFFDTANVSAGKKGVKASTGEDRRALVRAGRTT